MMEPDVHSTTRLRLLAVVALVHLGVAAALPFSKVSVDYASFVHGYHSTTPFLLADVYAIYWKARRISAALEVTIAGFLVLAPITVMTYLAIGVGSPLADARLTALDVALGFDWRGFLAWIETRPALATALGYAYISFFPQLMLIPIYFALKGRYAHAAAVVAANVMLCVLCSVVSVWFPAEGAYVAHGVARGDVVNVKAKFGFEFLDSFRALREQGSFLLTGQAAQGILTFPSVHAGVAAICAWAAWSSRLLRWPVLALNVGMAASAITHGGHYLVDIPAGFAMAAISIVAAVALFGRRPASSASAEPAFAFTLQKAS